MSQILSENRPSGMSQLDWLWSNYSSYNVQSEASDIPSSRALLTEEAITDLIQSISGGDGITKLTFEESPDDTSIMRLVGYGSNGSQLTLVTIPKEEHIISFVNRQVTQTDVDNGCSYVAGTDVLAITTNLDNTYMVSLKDLDIKLSGSETNTVYSEVINGVVTANVKIDENYNANDAVKLKTSTNGLYVKLDIDESTTGVSLEVSEDGLKAAIPMAGDATIPIQFDHMTLDEYLVSKVVENTIYFITDFPYIYLNNVRYGINLPSGTYPIISLGYDVERMELYYKTSDSESTQVIALGPVSTESNGMMTSDQYSELLRLSEALGDIDSVAEYVDKVNRTSAASLEIGEIINNQIPILLKDGNGDPLSTIYLDKENYLTFAEQRAATATEVEEAAKKEVTITEGTPILVLTLANEDIVYVNLAELSDIYTGINSDTISLNISNYTAEADIILPGDEKILYKTSSGLAAKISVVQDQSIVSIYGKTETEEDLLGKFSLNETLLGYAVLHNFNEQMLNTYPPYQVNGAAYDADENPIYYGHTYIVLTMGINAEDSDTSYQHNLYIDITVLLEEVKISEDEDNILTQGSDGHLYATVAWFDI